MRVPLAQRYLVQSCEEIAKGMPRSRELSACRFRRHTYFADGTCADNLGDWPPWEAISSHRKTHFSSIMSSSSSIFDPLLKTSHDSFSNSYLIHHLKLLTDDFQTLSLLNSEYKFGRVF